MGQCYLWGLLVEITCSFLFFRELEGGAHCILGFYSKAPSLIFLSHLTASPFFVLIPFFSFLFSAFCLYSKTFNSWVEDKGQGRASYNWLLLHSTTLFGRLLGAVMNPLEKPKGEEGSPQICSPAPPPLLCLHVRRRVGGKCVRQGWCVCRG